MNTVMSEQWACLTLKIILYDLCTMSCRTSERAKVGTLDKSTQSNQAMWTSFSFVVSHSHMAWRKSRGRNIHMQHYIELTNLDLNQLPSNVQVHVFKSKSGACAAFLSNFDPTYSTKLIFQNTQYDLPAWSISILPDCKTEEYNTAKVRKSVV